LNLVIWVLPFVLMVVGAVALYLGARRWVHRAAATQAPAMDTDQRYAERLKRELASHE
jgi:cytochrome c-type biogenesis protein CcmH/NrfF